MLICGMAQQVPKAAYEMAVIGVDRGALICWQEACPMICAIGDFDSISAAELKQIAAQTKLLRLPAHKNETDTEEAIRYALAEGYETIYVYGGLGGRVDHELANLHLLMYRQLPIVLCDEHNRIRRLSPGTYHIPKAFTYLSFFALEDSYISESGVAYPLEHCLLRPQDIFATSNEIIAESATITVHSGSVLMVEADDDHSQAII